MADLVTPIVGIISSLWTCSARHRNYLCELQQNMISLRNAMEELKDARNDVNRSVIEAEADLNEPKIRTNSVSGWLQSVEEIEGEVEVILQKGDEHSSRARCLGVCCPPNNCWSYYKLGKSIANKIPLVKDLKANGKFEEVTYVVRHTDYLCKLQDNKIVLRNAIEELKNVRNDVQRKVVEAEEAADQSEPKMRTYQVRGWLQSVENIESEVEVILQTSDEQLNNTRCHEKDKLVVMKTASVGELKRNGHFEELTYILPPSSVQDMNLESTVGMESMFDKFWRLINKSIDDQPVSNIIGLYGQGGVGKTTLLEKINNEFHNKISTPEQHGFDYVVIFVVVSKPINYEYIQKKIGERLGLSLQGDGDENSRAKKIFNTLKNKNYVLLLDDIWEKVDKKRIGIPIHTQDNSKLIFTTRSERVCGLMEATHTFQVECLPWDKAWRLFQDKVGEDALTSFPGARELAKDVAKECGGLPLALITIGRAMSTKKSVQEWRDGTTTLRRYASEFEGMSDEVLPRLKLSYDYLHNEAEKRCFRYCSLYPEDYSIEIAKLVDIWIAEGFLDGIDELDEARNRGHTIIGSLKSACLLESSDEHNHEKTHVKMHDVIRDLALWIVNDYRSSRSTNHSDNKFLVAVNDPCKKWKNAERIFWDATISGSQPVASPNLLTLIVRNIKVFIEGYYWPQSFFQHMPLLSVLDLSNTHFLNNEFPMSICELHELQYLNLSWTDIEELPVELRKLVKLKFLVLRNTQMLERIPAGVIANLSELQVLDLGCDSFGHGFEDWELEGGLSFSELDGLKQLQEVRITITTNVVLEKFVCNRKLQMVCTSLYCSSNNNSSSKRVLDLNNFKSLKDLDINGYRFSELEELVLYGSTTDDGGLLTNLEKLSLCSFSKLNNILWSTVAEQPQLSDFQSLQHIYISECDALKDLTWLVYVKNLKKLYVLECKVLEILIELGDDHGSEEGGRGVCQRLETIFMRDLPKLKSICNHALVFPSVQTINISQCPELKKLPLDSRSNINNTLNEIRGSTEWWSELEWEDETIKSKFLPYLNKGN